MRKPITAPLVCILIVAALVLPACGGRDSAEQKPASQTVPPEKVDDLGRRVADLVKQIEKLLKELESKTGDDSSGASAGNEKGGATGASSGGGAGKAGTGGRLGLRRGRRAAAAREARVAPAQPRAAMRAPGPDPGAAEDGRSAYDVCGPNPAPNC